jgi:TonB family protein
MKHVTLPRIKRISPYLCSFFLLASLAVSLTALSGTGQAQQQIQLTLADILTGLRSKKVTLEERNKLLTDAVRKRGITFSLTPEIEKELKITGADNELVEAVRQKSVAIKINLTSSSKPTVSTTVPSPPIPDFAFYQNRANAHFVKGAYDLALADYNKVIELNPKDAATYFSRAMAYYNKKSYDLAIVDYDKAIELSPKDSFSYFKRAELYEQKGNLQKAISDYQKTVELDASNEAAKNSLKRLQAEQAKNSPQPQQAPPQKTDAVSSSTPIPAASAASTAADASLDRNAPVELGLLNSIALNLPLPSYPEIARKIGIQGKVMIRVIIDEKGKIISAKGIEGHKMLRSVAEDAALKSKFNPTLVNNQAVQATGIIVYNFIN